MHLLTAVGLFASLTLPCAAQTPQLTSQPFPMDLVTVDGPFGSVELAPQLEAIDALRNSSAVTLTNVPLARDYSVTLELTRIRPHFENLNVYVDGALADYDSEQLVLFKGTVAGTEGSEVFLGLSDHGCHGWVHDGVERYNLIGQAGPGGDWSLAKVTMVSETGLLASGPNGPLGCSRSNALNVPGQFAPTITEERLGFLASTSSVTLDCPVAIETDFQLFEEFGNLTAEQNYIMMLLAAVSDRFEEQIDTVLTYPYVAFYTNSNDPWATPDLEGMDGGSTGNLLGEFRSAWEFNIPNGAALAHFLSGASLGGGIAYLNVLCNDEYAFAVSAGLGGNVSFPVQQGSSTWDFVVIAHEAGHQFATPHTHNFCPPIDECASEDYFGYCQDERDCISNGTIMSYCHTCSGGMNNITTYFHPMVADVMRDGALNSCLGPLVGDPVVFCSLSPNSANPGGASMDWFGSYSVSANDLAILAQDSVPGAFGLFYYGPEQSQTAFGNGFRCVGAGSTGVFRLGIASPADNSGSNVLMLDNTQEPMDSGPGAFTAGSTWNFQYWFRDVAAGGAGFNLSNGLCVQFLP